MLLVRGPKNSFINIMRTVIASKSLFALAYSLLLCMHASLAYAYVINVYMNRYKSLSSIFYLAS